MFENNLVSKFWAAKYFNIVTLETYLNWLGVVQGNIDGDTQSTIYLARVVSFY